MRKERGFGILLRCYYVQLIMSWLWILPDHPSLLFSESEQHHVLKYSRIDILEGSETEFPLRVKLDTAVSCVEIMKWPLTLANFHQLSLRGKTRRLFGFAIDIMCALYT